MKPHRLNKQGTQPTARQRELEYRKGYICIDTKSKLTSSTRHPVSSLPLVLRVLLPTVNLKMQEIQKSERKNTIHRKVNIGTNIRQRERKKKGVLHTLSMLATGLL